MVHPYFFEHPKPVEPDDMKFLKKLESYAADVFNKKNPTKKLKQDK